jgi:nitrate reductase delta subunit
MTRQHHAGHPAGISPFKLASVLLQYPTLALFGGLPALQAAAAGMPRASRAAFGAFLAWLAATPPDAVARHYVETFDLRRRCALYLTYHRHGDTRRRGLAMLAFSTAYAAAGFEPAAGEEFGPAAKQEKAGRELPDYLPMVLDFAALSPGGVRLLQAHRADLELLRRGLHEAGSPYAHVIEAVCAELPGLGRRGLSLVARAWAEGPPAEQVGLEPHAPPGYLSAPALQAARDGHPPARALQPGWGGHQAGRADPGAGQGREAGHA